jgi:hypothetical protein
MFFPWLSDQILAKPNPDLAGRITRLGQAIRGGLNGLGNIISEGEK